MATNVKKAMLEKNAEIEALKADIARYVTRETELVNEIERYTSLLGPLAKFYVRKRFGDRVTKIRGSQWTGRIVGFYSTELTPIGYAVESETERGSVQIYPEAALKGGEA